MGFNNNMSKYILSGFSLLHIFFTHYTVFVRKLELQVCSLSCRKVYFEPKPSQNDGISYHTMLHNYFIFLIVCEGALRGRLLVPFASIVTSSDLRMEHFPPNPLWNIFFYILTIYLCRIEVDFYDVRIAEEELLTLEQVRKWLHFNGESQYKT